MPSGRALHALALYDAIAPIYDEWQAWNGMTPFALVTAAKIAPLIEREAWRPGRQGAPSMLDLGCGTGTLLLKVRERQPDWVLCGMDASAGMLAAARAKREAGTIVWTRAPLEGPYPFAARFDLAAAFYDTINHAPDDGALGRVFRAVANVIQPGGLFMFDVTNQIGFDRWWRGRNDFRAATWRVTVEAHFDRATALGTAAIEVTRPGLRGRFRLTERHFERQDVERGLAKAGFVVERAEPWSPFPWDAPGKTLYAVRRAR